MIMFSAEFIGGDLLLRDLIFYSTVSEFYAPAVLICQTKEFVSPRNNEHVCHFRALRFHSTCTVCSLLYLLLRKPSSKWSCYSLRVYEERLLALDTWHMEQCWFYGRVILSNSLSHERDTEAFFCVSDEMHSCRENVKNAVFFHFSYLARFAARQYSVHRAGYCLLLCAVC
jgi:hypothetical protein